MSSSQTITPQIIVSFIVKHWISVTTAAASVISATACGAFWLGQQITESGSLAQQTELKETISMLRVKLEKLQTSADSLSSTNTQWRETYQKAQEIISQKDQEIAKLSSLLINSDNCTFIHKQIRETLSEIESINAPSILDADNYWRDRKQKEKAILENRLESYQDQLGKCNNRSN